MPAGFWIALAFQAAILIATFLLRDRYLARAQHDEQFEGGGSR
jgi:hypothetical protein